jgi:GDP-4-dehydro-6-deoxy-D-mannose reductase
LRVLITGAAGFVGSHLATALRADGHETLGVGLDQLDVRNRDAVDGLIAEFEPERIFHMAAQASVATSWRDPSLTYEVNVAGTTNVLDAIRRRCPDCRVLLPCTSDQYGIVAPDDCPIDESHPLRPISPYGVSKLAQEAVGEVYVDVFGLHVVVTRAFMHIGPGQPESFATGDWAKQIALIEAHRKDPVISVGNLDVHREFGDVRDVVRAYRLALEDGESGEVYNVATGDARRLREILEILLSLSRVQVELRVDARKLRPADIPVLEGDAGKLERLTGWKPEFALEDTLVDVLDHWRRAVA